MFTNISTDYTGADASFEILVMLLIAFIIGMLIGWILKPSKSYTKKIITPAAASYTTQKTTKTVVASHANKEDDLKLIEGIGPKIEKHLKKHGVKTFHDIIHEDVPGLESILLEGESKFKMHSPTTWPDQAKLASESKWSELEEYQDILTAGRKK